MPEWVSARSSQSLLCHWGGQLVICFVLFFSPTSVKFTTNEDELESEGAAPSM